MTNVSRFCTNLFILFMFCLVLYFSYEYLHWEYSRKNASIETKEELHEMKELIKKFLERQNSKVED